MTFADLEAKFESLLAEFKALGAQSASVTPQVAPQTTQTPLPPTITSPDLLTKMCLAITDYEGGPGDLNHINNNPGNLRQWPTEIGIHKGFAVFKTWQDGMNALRTLLTNAAKGLSANYRPDMSIIDFFETYAPTKDKNNPTHYAIFVAKRMGVSTSFQIKNLV